MPVCVCWDQAVLLTYNDTPRTVILEEVCGCGELIWQITTNRYAVLIFNQIFEHKLVQISLTNKKKNIKQTIQSSFGRIQGFSLLNSGI